MSNGKFMNCRKPNTPGYLSYFGPQNGPSKANFNCRKKVNI